MTIGRRYETSLVLRHAVRNVGEKDGARLPPILHGADPPNEVAPERRDGSVMAISAVTRMSKVGRSTRVLVFQDTVNDMTKITRAIDKRSGTVTLKGWTADGGKTLRPRSVWIGCFSVWSIWSGRIKSCAIACDVRTSLGMIAEVRTRGTIRVAGDRRRVIAAEATNVEGRVEA